MTGTRTRERGIVSLIAIVLLLSVVAVLAILSLQITSSGLSDTTQQTRSVQALMLAESGMENSIRRIQLGVAACDGTLATAPVVFGSGQFTVAAGLATDFDGVTALAASQCRTRVTGSAGNVTRTVEAVVETAAGGGAGIAFDQSNSSGNNNGTSVSFNVNGIDGGGIGNTILVVGVSVRDNNTVQGVTYRSAPLTYLCDVSINNNVRTAVYYLLGVANGVGADNVTATLNGGNTAIVAGGMSFTGVRQVPPVCATNSGTGWFQSVSINTTAANSYVVEVMTGRRDTAFAPWSGQTERWDAQAGPGGGGGVNRVRGAGGYRAVAVPGAVTDSWLRFFASQDWSGAILALAPASGAGNGVLRWREINRP